VNGDGETRLSWIICSGPPLLAKVLGWELEEGGETVFVVGVVGEFGGELVAKLGTFVRLAGMVGRPCQNRSHFDPGT
jgi:hypothetical protein